jgi:hypothetical protein
MRYDISGLLLLDYTVMMDEVTSAAHCYRIADPIS